MKCAVANCKSENKRKACDISFFLFPTDAKLAKKWKQFCRRGHTLNTKSSYVCMKHFTSEDIENNRQFELGFAKNRRLKRGVVPTIYEENQGDSQRAERAQHRENKRIVSELLQQSGTAAVTEAVVSDTIDVDITDESLNSRENSLMEANISDISRTSTPCKVFSHDSSLQEVEELDPKIETLKRENINLRKENKKQCTELAELQHEYEKQKKKHAYEVRQMQKRLDECENVCKNMERKLQGIFTKGQVAKLKYDIQKPTWTQEDVAQSITLYATSPKAYKLMYIKGFPLPGVRTLQKWTQKIDLSRGLIKPVFKLLKASTQMDTIQKVCVLSFGEMKIRQNYCYDTSSDSILEPANYVQVAMLRGLVSKWKQPVFYDFDFKMTNDMIFNILQSTKVCGYNVVAVVCDLGGTNGSLLNGLGVHEDRPWFVFDEQQVFTFADVPHMLQLLRNNFLDQGFVINGKSVKKEIILELLSITSNDLTITHKISENDLNESGLQRQKVKTAAKLFSHTVAQAITRAAGLGHLNGHNWKECFKLFKLTSDWFDVMNVRKPHADERTRCRAYGLAIDEQVKMLDGMTEMMKSMRVIGKHRLLPFQRGIIQSSNALKMLYESVKNRFNMKYILTYRLNQDVIENFFEVIRAKGGLHDHPDQQEFKYHFRGYLLGRSEGVISNSANLKEHHTPDLEISQPPLTGFILKRFVPEEWPIDIEPVEFEDLEYDGPENLADYICHRLRDDIPSTSLKGADDPPTPE